MFLMFFFFSSRRRHTRFKCDWSSDVCSSDLMGIVTKNAIMLVEFAVESMREGKPREVAIIDAGMKRARPIVMTTIAMAAGMMPSALAFGAGGEFRSPMALAVIGGLLFSTVLSLVFVPAMFMLMDDIGTTSW